MQIAALRNVDKNCYKSRHISDDFTNTEQLSLCAAEEHEKIFGDFYRNQENHRHSD